MKTRELSRQHDRLRGLFKKTADATSGDLETQAHWANYLCVLSAGFLENALREIYGQYCDRRASKEVVRFTRKQLARILNPKANRFVEVAESFVPHWKLDLENFISENGRKDAIDSIMSNRHRIAHGKDTNITLVRVGDYLKKSIEVIEYIEKQCDL